MATYQLSNIDTRLAFLAIQQHLARPGSELDPRTGQPQEHGLAEVGQALEPQLAQTIATIDLSEYQRERLVLAIAGTVNELKAYPLVGPGHSTVPGFDETLQRLLPQVREEPEEAAMHLVALRRRLGGGATAPSATGADLGSGTRPWWRFWGRGGK